MRHRGDLAQATRLSRCLGTVTTDYADAILPFDEEIAQIWASWVTRNNVVQITSYQAGVKAKTSYRRHVRRRDAPIEFFDTHKPFARPSARCSRMAVELPVYGEWKCGASGFRTLRDRRLPQDGEMLADCVRWRLSPCRWRR